MRLADHYDVICAGGGLSSYLCAALLARVGKKVLVIDDDDQALPRRCERSAVFDPDFAIFTGLGKNAALGKSLDELGLRDANSFKPLDAVTQVLTPDYRVVFWGSEEEACKELRREIKTGSSTACDFFSLLYRAGREIPSFVEGALTPTQGRSAETSDWRRFWGRYYRAIAGQKPVALSKTFSGKPGAESCEKLGAAVLGALSYAAPYNLGSEQSIRGLSLPLQGQSYYVGGLEALKRRLATIILASGGGVKRDTRVESLISETGKISGVLLSSYEGIIRSDVVVLSSRLRRLYQTLPDEIQDSILLRSLSRVEPVSWRFTISITVHRSVIPLGVTSTMTYVGSYQHPLEEENYLRIQIVPASLYPETSDPEHVTLLITALVPYRASYMDYAYLRRLGGKMLRSLAELMPFLEHNIVSVHPDFRKGEQALREFYPFQGSDWVPENLMQYYIRGHKAVQNFWGPAWTTPHPNLYFAGRAIWPALGIYGEALTARKIFDDVMLPQ